MKKHLNTLLSLTAFISVLLGGSYFLVKYTDSWEPARHALGQYSGLLFYLSALFALLFIGLSLWLVPKWQTSSLPHHLGADRKFEIENKTRRTLALILITVTALFGTILFWESLEAQMKSIEIANKTLQLTGERQTTEQLIKATEQLGETDGQGKVQMQIRLGGIYALGRIANESPKIRTQIGELLSAYIREHSPLPRPDPDEDGNASNISQAEKEEPKKPGSDIQAAITVLGELPSREGRKFPLALDLTRTNLRGLNLRGAHLTGVRLGECILANADLKEADLREANLVGANLSQAELTGAILDGAILVGADLSDAKLKGASFKKADLVGAIFENADLEEADLTGANLVGANLTRANLKGSLLEDVQMEDANLEQANLTGADLRGANLLGADLEEAYLEETKMAGANLLGANLKGAYLWKADLKNANLERTNLDEADMENTVLLGTSLNEAAMAGTNIAGANLSEADLRNAKNLVPKQFSEVKMLRNIKLDPILLAELKREHPELFNERENAKKEREESEKKDKSEAKEQEKKPKQDKTRENKPDYIEVPESIGSF